MHCYLRRVINDELNIKSDASSNVEKFPRVDKFIMVRKPCVTE